MNKSGFIYSNMRKFRAKYAVILVIFIIAVILFAANSSEYIIKKIIGSTPLDLEKFATVETQVLPADYTMDVKNEDKKIYNFATPSTSYWQGNRYYFSAVVEDVANVETAFTYRGAPVTSEVDTDADPIMLKATYAVIGGITVPVITKPNQNILKGDTIEGIFTNHSPLILEQLAKKSGGKDMEICGYTLDTRGIEMGSEHSVCTLVLISIILIIYLLVKLIIYFVNPLKHPIYAQLDKYGEIQYVAEDVDKEIENNITNREKGIIYTTNWIVTKKEFKYQIIKNHAAGGKFKYTP